jgi:hypothetical protein
VDPDTPYFGGTDLTVPETHIRPVHGRSSVTEPPRRLRLGEALVEAGVITQEDLTRCLAEQADDPSTPRRRLGEIITSRGLASEVDIALGLSTLTGFTYVDYAGLVLDPVAIRRVPRAVCERHLVLPLGAGETWLRLAMSDPSDRIALDVVRELTGAISISVAISTSTAIRDALARAWAVPEEELARERAAQVRAAPAAPVVETVTPPEPELHDLPPTVVGEAWDYLFVGDGMPMDHPGYTMDVPGLDLRLAELGALGWEAVGVHSNGSRARVLLKRRRPS